MGVAEVVLTDWWSFTVPSTIARLLSILYEFDENSSRSNFQKVCSYLALYAHFLSKFNCYEDCSMQLCNYAVPSPNDVKDASIFWEEQFSCAYERYAHSRWCTYRGNTVHCFHTKNGFNDIIRKYSAYILFSFNNSTTIVIQYVFTFIFSLFSLSYKLQWIYSKPRYKHFRPLPVILYVNL